MAKEESYLDKHIKFDFDLTSLNDKPKKRLNKAKLKEDARMDHQKDQQKRKATDEEIKTAFKNAVLGNQKFFKKNK